jgi:hypothetical protein
VRSQVGRVVAAVAVVGALVGGCGSGPSQTGSAAIIGSGSIPLGAVQDDIAAALAPEKALGSAAGDPAGGSLYGPERAREETRDQLTAAALGARYVDRLGVALQVAVIPTEDEALTTARALAEGGTVADAALAGLPPGSSQALEVTAAQALGQFPLYPFGTAEGSVVVARPPQEGLDFEVVRIVERREQPAAGPSAVDQIPVTQLAAFGYQLLQPDATELGVQVNPRYGVWDPLQMSVVAQDQVIGTVVPAADQR